MQRNSGNHPTPSLQDQQDVLQNLLDHAPLSMVAVDRDYAYTAFNRKYAQEMLALYGAKIELGHNLLDYISNLTERNRVQKNLERVLAGEEFTEPTFMVGPDQSRVFFNIRHIPVRDESGAVVGANVFSEDTTELMQGQCRLNEKNTFLGQVIEAMGQGLTVAGPDGRFELVNPAYANLVGYPPQALIGKHPRELTAPEALPVLEQAIRLREQGQPNTYESCLLGADGSRIPVLINGVSRSQAGQKPGSIAVITDLSEHKRTELSLRQAEEKYHSFVSQASEAFILTDENGLVIEWNPAAEKVTGLPAAETLGQPIWEVNLRIAPPEKCQPEFLANFPLHVQRILREGLGSALGHYSEHEIVQPNGERRILNQLLFTVPTEAGFRLGSITRDVTEARQVEQALFASEARYRLLFENMNQGFALHQILVDEAGQVGDFRILAANAAYEQHTGFKLREVLGKTLLEILPQADRHQIETYGRVALTGEPLDVEYYSETFKRHLHVRAFSPQPSYFATIFEDITARKLAEEQLLQSEERFRSVVSAMAEGVVIYSADKVVQFCNASAEAILGLSAAQIKGWTAASTSRRDTIHEDGSPFPDETQPAMLTLRTGQPCTGVILGLHLPDDNLRWISINSQPIFKNGSSQPAGVVATFVDVTAQRQAQAEIRFQAYLLGEVRQAVVATDLNGRYLHWNRFAEELFGPRSGEFLEPGIPDPVMLAQMLHVRQQALEHGVWKGELHFKAFSGKPLLLESTVSLLKDEAGQAIGYVGVMEEISARKQAEVALQKSEQQYRDLFDTNTAIKLLIDPLSGAIVRANKAAAIFYGWSVAELETMNIEQINTLQNEQIKTHMTQAVKRKHSSFHFQHRQASGELRDVEVYSSPIEVDERQLLFSIIHDITDRKKAEAALRAAHAELEQRVQERTAELQTSNEALEKALRAKNEFMALMSHELRTPLTGVLGLAQLLQLPSYGALNEKQRLAVVNIEKSGQRLQGLFDKILDFTDFQSSLSSAKRIRLSVGDLCRSVLSTLHTYVEKKDQTVTFSQTPEVIYLDAPEKQIRKILFNLLENASKFTPNEGQLGLQITGDPETHQLSLRVWDQGIGIKAEDFPRLFQPFTQLDASLSREYEGAGLGLVLVKQAVEALGGTVSVESVPGQGSSFTVHLPWQETELPPQ